MTDTRWDRWAAASGVAFAVLAIVGYLFAMNIPARGSSGEEVTTWFADNDTAVMWESFFFGLAVVAFLWFVGTLAAAIRRAENDPAGRLPAIIVITGATAAALYMGGQAGLLTLAQATGLEAGTALAIHHTAGSAFALTNFVVVALVTAVSLAITRTAFLPAWLAYAGGVYVIVALVDGIGTTLSTNDTFGAGNPLGVISFVAFLAWTLITSALLTQRVMATEPTPRMAPT
jgi:hypothetical protein